MNTPATPSQMMNEEDLNVVCAGIPARAFDSGKLISFCDLAEIPDYVPPPAPRESHRARIR